MERQSLGLVDIIRHWQSQPHQVAALNLLQEQMPKELLDPTSEWIELWYTEETSILPFN